MHATPPISQKLSCESAAPDRNQRYLKHMDADVMISLSIHEAVNSADSYLCCGRTSSRWGECRKIRGLCWVGSNDIDDTLGWTRWYKSIYLFIYLLREKSILWLVQSLISKLLRFTTYPLRTSMSRDAVIDHHYFRNSMKESVKTSWHYYSSTLNGSLLAEPNDCPNPNIYPRDAYAADHVFIILLP